MSELRNMSFDQQALAFSMRAEKGIFEVQRAREIAERKIIPVISPEDTEVEASAEDKEDIDVIRKLRKTLINEYKLAIQSGILSLTKDSRGCINY